MPYTDLRMAAMDHRLHATVAMAETFYQLFVNRRAYTLQSHRPHPDTERHFYYRPKAREGQPPPALSLDIIRQHLAGKLTLGIYAINPRTQRSKWVAIDADYKNALEDLLKLQYELRQDGVEPALVIQRDAALMRARLLAAPDPAALLPDLLVWDAALKRQGFNPGSSADLTVATIFTSRLRNSLRFQGF